MRKWAWCGRRLLSEFEEGMMVEACSDGGKVVSDVDVDLGGVVREM
jgi:hypothetical protein